MSLNLSKNEKKKILKFVKFRCINKNYINWVFIFSFRFFPWSFQHLKNGNKFRFELFDDKGKRFNIIEKLIFDKNSKIIVSIIYFTIKMRAALSYDKIIRYKFIYFVCGKRIFFICITAKRIKSKTWFGNFLTLYFVSEKQGFNCIIIKLKYSIAYL